MTERGNAGLDAMEGLLEGSHQMALERDAQMEDLLWEADRQIRIHRVDPRWEKLVELNAEARGPMKGRRKALDVDRLVELNAEARRPMKGRRKAEVMEGLLNRPMKGGLNLMKDARKRRLVEPRGRPPRATRLTAELRSRPLLTSRWMRMKGPFSMDLDRSEDSQEVFGMRWMPR